MLTQDVLERGLPAKTVDQQTDELPDTAPSRASLAPTGSRCAELDSGRELARDAVAGAQKMLIVPTLCVGMPGWTLRVTG